MKFFNRSTLFFFFLIKEGGETMVQQSKSRQLDWLYFCNTITFMYSAPALPSLGTTLMYRVSFHHNARKLATPFPFI